MVSSVCGARSKKEAKRSSKTKRPRPHQRTWVILAYFRLRGFGMKGRLTVKLAISSYFCVHVKIPFLKKVLRPFLFWQQGGYNPVTKNPWGFWNLRLIGSWVLRRQSAVSWWKGPPISWFLERLWFVSKSVSCDKCLLFWFVIQCRSLPEAPDICKKWFSGGRPCFSRCCRWKPSAATASPEKKVATTKRCNKRSECCEQNGSPKTYKNPGTKKENTPGETQKTNPGEKQNLNLLQNHPPKKKKYKGLR